MHEVRNHARDHAHRRRERALAAYASARFGVVGRGELLALGFSLDEIDHRVALGRLVEVFEGAFSHGVAPLMREGRWRAAVLSCGRGALLSHRSAAELLDLLPGSDREPHVVVPRDGPRRRRGIVVHGALTLEPSECRGIRCTTPSRTLVDLAGQVRPSDLEDAVARAARGGTLDAVAILAILDTGARYRGARRLRRVLAERDPRSGPTRSRFEQALRSLCRRYDLPLPIVNAQLDVGLPRPLEVDFLWPEERVVVETDGFAFHSDPSRLVEDRRRDVALKLAGYERLRFSWPDLTRREEVTAGQIRTLLRRCASEPEGLPRGRTTKGRRVFARPFARAGGGAGPIPPHRAPPLGAGR